ncbi:MAG: lytic murein transglycosylase [Candidatus Paceibacterota bacterium]
MAGFTLSPLTSVTPIFAQSQELQNAQLDKAKLEAELASLEQEIAQKMAVLDGQKNQSASIKRDISILKTKIDKAKLDIRSRALTITKLTNEINQKKQTIEVLSDKITSDQESLAVLLRKTNEIDNASIISLILKPEQKISDFYGDLDSFASINQSIKISVNQIRGVKSQTETEKQSLEQKQNQEIDAKMELESAKRQVEKNQAQKDSLLKVSQQKEKEYQKVLAERERKAAEIRSALFNLAGGGVAIPFGDALKYATFASQKTGVSPAFLLAILTQETNLGANQGSCYLSVPETGAGIRVKTGVSVSNVMKPSRDVAPFLDILKNLGRDPFKTIVSCPMAGGGYGGGMGPSQFIPSTWQIMASKTASALGKLTADPWNPQDAFMASALYLSDLGASTTSYTAKKNAACRYYSGRSCDSKKPANTFYGNSVMALMQKIQENEIDPLQGI